MEDELSRKIDALLNSPDGMEKIRSTMAALGLAGDETAEKPSETPAVSSETSAGDGGLGGLLNLAPLLGSLGGENEHTALLKALRPYLHSGREKRLDDSIKLMQLIKLLPLLQGGLFK